MTAAPERPVLLPSNQPANRFYAGGPKIRAFRHEEGSIDHVPEDWVASTTTIFGEKDIGLTELPTGERLRDAVLGDPVGWLGRDHHAQFGAGVFIVEVQEPEDMSVLLEWTGFAIDGPRHGHLGIGVGKALEATDRHGWSLAELETLLVHAGTGGHTLVPQAGSYFRAEHRSVAGETVLEESFSILVILLGSGQLTAANGSHVVLEQGLTILTPHNIGELTITGELTLLRCRPPMPDQAR